jgi:hypothetical protein
MAVPGPYGKRLEGEILALIAEHDSCWCRCDFDGIADLWDPGDKELVYIGEEYSEPLYGEAALQRHWGRLGGRIRAAEMSTEVIAVRELSPDLALLVLRAEWSLRAVESDERRAGCSWITALARRRVGGWRFVHQMEASAGR